MRLLELRPLPLPAARRRRLHARLLLVAVLVAVTSSSSGRVVLRAFEVRSQQHLRSGVIKQCCPSVVDVQLSVQHHVTDW